MDLLYKAPSIAIVLYIFQLLCKEKQIMTSNNFLNNFKIFPNYHIEIVNRR